MAYIVQYGGHLFEVSSQNEMLDLMDVLGSLQDGNAQRAARITALEAERDAARQWARAWKRAASFEHSDNIAGGRTARAELQVCRAALTCTERERDAATAEVARLKDALHDALNELHALKWAEYEPAHPFPATDAIPLSLERGAGGD